MVSYKMSAVSLAPLIPLIFLVDNKGKATVAPATEQENVKLIKS